MQHQKMTPEVVLLLSGKRKSGKDYIAEKLLTILGNDCQILRISEPIKSYYAEHLNLDLKELLSDNVYKEKYRQDMIMWSDEIRKKEPGYFCKMTCSKAANKQIWIISDIRRKTDIKWFYENYCDKIKTVRISANEKIRSARGWTYTQGVDDVASECDLDDWKDWNLVAYNNDEESLKDCLEKILNLITIKY